MTLHVSRKLLKAVLFCHQKNIKGDNHYMKFPSSPNNSVYQVSRHSLFQSHHSLFCRPLFLKKYHNPQVRINKNVNKHSVNYHFRNLPSHLSEDSLVLSLSLSRNFVEFVVVWKHFQICSLQITGK